MKKSSLFSILITFLLMAGFQDAASQNKTGNASAGSVNIPQTKSVMSIQGGRAELEKAKRITAEERKTLQIDKMKKDAYDLGNKPNKEIAKGKSVYQGDKGMIVTLLNIIEDQGMFEQLVSYDAKGNYVDHIEIGQDAYYAGDRGESIIEGNIVTRIGTWADMQSEGRSLQRYEITPALKFKEIK